MKLLLDNKNALESAYKKYADMLFRLALTHTGSREDAEDALHDVFFKYSNAHKNFIDDEHEKAWLIRVCVNHCHDLSRIKKRRTFISLEDICEVAADEDNRIKDDIDQLMNTMNLIPEKYKATIILHYLEGYSIAETAEILKVSVSAVKMRLARAREILKTELNKLEV